MSRRNREKNNAERRIYHKEDDKNKKVTNISTSKDEAQLLVLEKTPLVDVEEEDGSCWNNNSKRERNWNGKRVQTDHDTAEQRLSLNQFPPRKMNRSCGHRHDHDHDHDHDQHCFVKKYHDQPVLSQDVNVPTTKKNISRFPTTTIATITTTRSTIPPAQSPHDYLLTITEAKPKSSLDTTNFFHVFSDKDVEHYTREAIDAVRNLDMTKLKSMHKEGKSFQCSNSFGESLLHMACRHGSFDIVHFFVCEAKVNIQCRDDVGRTPLHDACWSSEPNFELVEFIICLSPCLLLMKDKRGHAPLEYTRREHWVRWISFLDRHKDMLRDKLVWRG